MSFIRVCQGLIGMLIGVLGMVAEANQDQTDPTGSLMRDQAGYPPLQQAVPSPPSNDYPQAENLSPMYPAVTTEVSGDYPPIGYEPETRAATSKPTQEQATAVQRRTLIPYPAAGPQAGQPQAPYPYQSHEANVWTPAVGGFARPAAPPSTSTPVVPSDYPSPPGSVASGSPTGTPTSSPPPRPPTGEYPPLAGESSSGYPYSRTPHSTALRHAQPYPGHPPPPGYGAYPPGPYGPYPPPPPYYGGPPYPGRW